MSDKPENEKKGKKSKSEKKAKKAEKLERAEKAEHAANTENANESGREIGKQGKETPYIHLFREIGMKLNPSTDSSLEGLELSPQQGQMLSYIYMFQEEGIIQNDLAKRFSRTGASISSMLQGLEKKGYVRRVVPKGNERQKRVYVTPKAEPLISGFDRIFVELEQRITEGMTTEEADMLNTLLEKVKSNL